VSAAIDASRPTGASRRKLGEKLPADDTLDNFDFAAVPMISKALVSELSAGVGWLDKRSNLPLLGPPGGGKPHSPWPRVGPRGGRPAASIGTKC
jgi:hypothetical protein